MTHLEWCDLATKFYSLKKEARKYDFYTKELKEIEDSLYNMRPIQSDILIERIAGEDT